MPFEKTQLFYKNKFPRTHAVIVWSAVFLAAVTLVAVPGFRIEGALRDFITVIQFVIAWLFVLENAANLVLHFNRKTYLARNWPVVIVILGFAGLQIAGIEPHLVVKVFLFLSIILVFSRLLRNINAFARRPAVTLIGSYMLLILVGSVLLALPGSSGDSGSLGLIDAMFTSTSATCVTGLVVKDTFADFSPFGRLIILMLIQVGGLGLMTFGAFFALAVGGGYGIRDRTMMTGLLETKGAGTVTRLIIFILLFTFVFEAAGFFLLNGVWEKDGQLLGQTDQAYYSAFHSVSAFCNAGFTFFSDSFISLRDKFGIAIVVPLLIIVGGLGFAVCLNLLTMIGSRVSKFFGRGRQIFEDIEIARPRMTVHTKLVLITTIILLFGSFVTIYLLEGNNPETLLSLEGWRKAEAVFFQAVTARTAGFNTVDTKKLTDASKFFLIILMMIGASPGSTGGGIKTVTLAILAITLWSTIRGRPRVEVFKRTIPDVIVRRAFLIAVLGVFLTAVAALLLSVTERASGEPFLNLLFEATSAFGTVGLSAINTWQLTDIGKVLIMILMLIGRIGPLTVVVAIIQKPGKTELPSERVMVG
ncbi:MAG: potassium transporter TrkG [Planctomycetota bacterium]